MKGISARSSDVVVGMVMSAGEAGMKMITGLINQIIADWELCAII